MLKPIQASLSPFIYISWTPTDKKYLSSPCFMELFYAFMVRDRKGDTGGSPMGCKSTITDWDIQALVDNGLHPEEERILLNAIQNDEELKTLHGAAEAKRKPSALVER